MDTPDSPTVPITDVWQSQVARPIVCDHCKKTQTREEQTGRVVNDWTSVQVNGNPEIYDLCATCSKKLWPILEPMEEDEPDAGQPAS